MLLVIISINGCVDTEFDEPENTLEIKDADIVSIASVLDLLSSSGVELTADNLGGDPRYIKATVSADDASGNFYRSLVFQDASGGISVSADQNELNAEFPEGNIIYIKLNGLYIASDAGTPRIGHSISNGRLQRIPDALVKEFLLAGGKADMDVAPEVIELSDFLNNSAAYYNKLITITDVEFTDDFLGGTYAISDGPDGPQTVNTMIQDCNDREVILRNSGFSSFASRLIPAGNGSITAIPGVFNNDLQLFIRDTDDVDFTGTRCDGTTGGGDETDIELTIQSLQDRYYDQGADSAPEGFVKGIVISDRHAGQVHRNNIFLQNGEDGIVVRFSAEHNFELGDELRIVITGRELSEFNDLFQLNNIPLLNVENLGSASLPVGKELTIAEILANNNTYESTRVLIKGATLTGSTFGGGVEVDDGTGTIDIFTFNSVTFANDPVPSGTVDVTAILSQFNDPQLLLNDSDDVEGGTTTGGGDEFIKVDFQDQTDDSDISISGWMNIATKGTRKWQSKSFNDERYAECEGFMAADSEVEAWLITPTIDTDENPTLTFETAQAFWQHQGLSVWVSSDFSDIGDADWVEITSATLANESDEFFDIVSSGSINLPDFVSGMVRVGWKYVGDPASNTTKMRIDNVIVK